MTTSLSFPLSSPFGSGLSFVPRSLQGVQTSTLTGGSDRLIDPSTRDYVRTANGEWVETQDSRTIMLIALSVKLGKSPFSPNRGTSVADAIARGELASPEFLQAEVSRSAGQLVAEGIITDLVVLVRDEDGEPLVDEAGRQVVQTQYQDLASGSPINAVFTPR